MQLPGLLKLAEKSLNSAASFSRWLARLGQLGALRQDHLSGRYKLNMGVASDKQLLRKLQIESAVNKSELESAAAEDSSQNEDFEGFRNVQVCARESRV